MEMRVDKLWLHLELWPFLFGNLCILTSLAPLLVLELLSLLLERKRRYHLVSLTTVDREKLIE